MTGVNRVLERYRADRTTGTWRVLDTRTGDVVDVYGPGAPGALAATEAAARLNTERPARARAPTLAASELRAWRHTHGLSQARLAALLGVQWLTVQRWEAGTSGVPPYLSLALKQLALDLQSARTEIPQ